MKLWHSDPPHSPPQPVDRESRDALGELIFVFAVAALGVLGLYVSRGG